MRGGHLTMNNNEIEQKGAGVMQFQDSSGASKRLWKTPKLVEVAYAETRLQVSGMGSDLDGWS